MHGPLDERAIATRRQPGAIGAVLNFDGKVLINKITFIYSKISDYT
jgi:hypothetical protein